MLALAEQNRASALCDRERCLRYRLPELRVVAEKDPSPAPFQRRQPVKRGQHRLAVVLVARQAALAEGPTKVAGISGEHDLAAIELQPKGLVPRRVHVRRQTHHRAIAKHVVLAIDEAQFMAGSKSRGLNPRRAAVSGSIPASHSRRCTNIVALGISALPPT